MNQNSKDSDMKNKILEIFQRHDNENTGYLEREQVRKVMEEIYEDFKLIQYNFCDDDVESLLRQTDSDGKIQIEKFVSLM